MAPEGRIFLVVVVAAFHTVASIIDAVFVIVVTAAVADIVFAAFVLMFLTLL